MKRECQCDAARGVECTLCLHTRLAKMAAAGNPAAASNPVGGTNSQPLPCPHRGTSPATDPATGERRTRECQACGNDGRVKLFVYQCNHPSLPKGPEVTIHQDCRICEVQGKKSILIRFPHGLGDTVGLLAVIAHLAKYRPNWTVDLSCDYHYHPLFAGTNVANLYPLDFAKQSPTPKKYDDTFDLEWPEGDGNHQHWPSTKVVKCLLEVFKIQPEKELLRYKFTLAPASTANTKGKTVAIHYAGNQCKGGKDIATEIVNGLFKHITARFYNPMVIDHADDGINHLASILAQSALNITIDSGPQKLAMTQTLAAPLLCVWQKSHPLHYVDYPDDPNVVHLVPENHADYLEHSNGVSRHCNVSHGLAFFHANFRHHVYKSLADGLREMVDYLLGVDTTIAPREPTRVAVEPLPVAPARKILLHTGLPPGDVMTMTAAVEMLHEQHPGKYQVAVSTNNQELWENNPRVVPRGREVDDAFTELNTLNIGKDENNKIRVHERDGAIAIDMQYHLVNESGNRPVHFIQGYTEFLADALKIPLKLTTNRPHLYLSQDEKNWMNQVWEVTKNAAPYWVLNAGVKRDYTAKQWPWFQEVVNLLRGRVRFAQIGKESDLHPALTGVVNLVGKTSDRALIRLVYHAQGVLSGVTFLMHLAAAFEKPAVIVAGGREPRLWNSYPTQTLLATVGALDCCRRGGCWKSRVGAQNDGNDGSLCERPMPTMPPAGECMTRISPEFVARAVESYLP